MPKGVIPEKKMEELLYDYHLARAMGENVSYNDNYKKVLYMDYVFEKHGTTEAVFDSSMVWYTRHTEILTGIYERISERLKKNQKEIDRLVAIRDNKATTSLPGDSIDLWLWNHLYALSAHPMNNKVSFTIPSDSNFFDRDTLRWELNYHYLGSQPDSLQAAIMALQVLYSKDTIISERRRIMESGKQTITLQADTLGDIKSIKGFVYYLGGKDSLDKLLLNDISLVRYHSLDTLLVEKTDTVPSEKKKVEEPVKVETPKEEIPLDKEKPETVRPMPNRPRPSAAREAKPVEQEPESN